jgi:hypothetical protein
MEANIRAGSRSFQGLDGTAPVPPRAIPLLGLMEPIDPIKSQWYDKISAGALVRL